MKKSSEKQFKRFKRLKRFKQPIVKLLGNTKADGKKFFNLVNKKIWLGSSLILIILLFLLLPSPGYYQTLHLFRQPAKIKKVDIGAPVYPYPVNNTQKEPPVISARSIVVVDVDSAVILYQKNSDLPLLPASTTKIMTGIVALENYSLDQVLTVGNLEENGQTIKLLSGERMTVENLLYGLLVASGNDAATVLASYLPGGQQTFVAAMNQKAHQLNLANTHFENPTGIDHPSHYSTALDLARLSVYALKNPVFARMVATPKITVWDIDGKIPHSLFNINQLVGKNLGVLGVKTGWTQEAGECLVAYVRKNGQGIITVILGSQDRFGETEKIIDWVFGNFVWEVLTPSL